VVVGEKFTFDEANGAGVVHTDGSVMLLVKRRFVPWVYTE
jgi:hypothetical protein